ncbi:hypothetical protein IPC1077_27355 [Pseudomonas aeruginosa]|nr:hypothetical protein AO979_02485 [Pseudomonas aeruginosa]OFB79787.1 hypothetical protein AN469_27120 [Pseudomonas aeruginosa]PBM83452.1 hypothetical protein B8B59_27080 [Pseudomonas aeruginosa]RPQ65112.1 hypothetical protein IPC1078_25135 [Pseudomonas aeruginosa]RPQ77221.1 hypothetical protein IPC1077_27355 [Pseudomonas aeruginosa]
MLLVSNKQPIALSRLSGSLFDPITGWKSVRSPMFLTKSLEILASVLIAAQTVLLLFGQGCPTRTIRKQCEANKSVMPKAALFSME